ncbi:MAG: DNA polymerase I [Lachnospiraceae bacterium]|nr:DNA polymerase I [Lachnospiraceae bacterium]MBQ9122047.1 DNA polymerase I [Lachnospiraceae bacterium]
MSKKLVLIDGHSILNRAFYGVPDLTNAKGLHTNGVYGFLNILFKLLEEEKPDYLAVAFDVKAPTFRHEMYKEYKGTRKPMPEELRQQVPVLKDMLKAMGITILEQPGLEADDILGTLAKKADREGISVSLVSGDRDLLQIATERIKIRIPKTRGGKTEIEDYYAQDVLDKYQVTPTQFIELKALMGDTADNIPGVPKVGEKTATNLMVTYGSIEGIYEHLDELKGKAIKESLIEHRDLAELSKVLATIKTDSDIALDYEQATAEGFFTPEAYALCKELEFKNMLSRFETKPETKTDYAQHLQVIDDLGKVEECFASLQGKTVAVYPLIQEDLIGVALAASAEQLFFVAVEGLITAEYLKDKVRTLSANGNLYFFDIKKYYEMLSQDSTEQYFDVLLGAYLLNPLKNDYDMEAIASEHLRVMIPGWQEVFGKESVQQFYDKDAAKVRSYAATLAFMILQSAEVLKTKVKEAGMESLMREVEMPLTLVLYDMQKEGVMIRPDELHAYGEALVGRIQELEQSIHEAAGCEFNIQSPKQLGEVLFEKMAIPGGKKTKTGYSTAADVLEKLQGEYPIVADILEYRTLTKLKSTYADGLTAYIDEDMRIRSNFNQTITATGRISSTEPNLQNIPMRMELGRRIRKVFVPKEGYVLMDADYSQIELRVLAHMSGDEQLIEAYKQDEDIHRITAAKVFHTPLDQVTDLQRRNAKAVNFGIVYGISSFGLSQDLSISVKEAKAYIDQYFATYPKVKLFLEELVEGAKLTGYVTTLFGRRRPIPELSSSNFMQRSFGERVAMNSPIQGTAADIMKIAMIHVWKELKDKNLKSKLILQVHDELLIETAKDEVETVKEILERNMKSAANLAVSLEVDLHTGANWYEAK